MKKIKNILCRVGVHEWVYDRIAELNADHWRQIWGHSPTLHLEKGRYILRLKHCKHCKKLKVTVPHGTVCTTHDDIGLSFEL
jgi:hypothetical protein